MYAFSVRLYIELCVLYGVSLCVSMLVYWCMCVYTCVCEGNICMHVY